jgi:hypothetical protein
MNLVHAYHGRSLFPFQIKKITLLGIVVLVGSYFVSGLEMHQSILSWPKGFLLRGLLLF